MIKTHDSISFLVYVLTHPPRAVLVVVSYSCFTIGSFVSFIQHTFSYASLPPVHSHFLIQRLLLLPSPQNAQHGAIPPSILPPFLTPTSVNSRFICPKNEEGPLFLRVVPRCAPSLTRAPLPQPKFRVLCRSLAFPPSLCCFLPSFPKHAAVKYC